MTRKPFHVGSATRNFLEGGVRIFTQSSRTTRVNLLSLTALLAISAAVAPGILDRLEECKPYQCIRTVEGPTHTTIDTRSVDSFIAESDKIAMQSNALVTKLHQDTFSPVFDTLGGDNIAHIYRVGPEIGRSYGEIAAIAGMMAVDNLALKARSETSRSDYSEHLGIHRTSWANAIELNGSLIGMGEEQSELSATAHLRHGSAARVAAEKAAFESRQDIMTEAMVLAANIKAQDDRMKAQRDPVETYLGVVFGPATAAKIMKADRDVPAINLLQHVRLTEVQQASYGLTKEDGESFTVGELLNHTSARYEAILAGVNRTHEIAVLAKPEVYGIAEPSAPAPRR